MNEQDVLKHLAGAIPEDKTELFGAAPSAQFGSLFDIGKKILAAIQTLIGTSGADVEIVVAACRKYYDALAAKVPVPSYFKNLVWTGIEYSIRQLFSQVTPEGAT